MDRIDLRIGEARIIRDVACAMFNLETISLKMNSVDYDYQSWGYEPLVAELEDRHSAPIVITNGATQALHAVMHVLRSKGHKSVSLRAPYWNRLKPIVESAELRFVPLEPSTSAEAIDSFLLTAPNNPDGYMPTLEKLREGVAILRDRKIPVIHDAVYYTKTYLPCDTPIEPLGDVQIFSASKMFGLSSLRLGWIVVRNDAWLKPLLDFIEASTVGSSVVSQKILHGIFKRDNQLPWLMEKFYKQARTVLQKARSTWRAVDRSRLEIPDDFDKTFGVFGWCKPLIPNLFERLGIEVLDGATFGRPGWARVNLAAGNELVIEAVKRINTIEG